MSYNLYRLCCPTARHTSKLLLPKQVWIHVNRPVGRMPHIKACNSVRLCQSGRPQVLKCIAQDHYRLTISRSGSLSRQLFSRQFHTSGGRHAVPPLIWLVVSYTSKITVALTGRKWRNWLSRQPASVQRKHYRGIRALFATLGLFLAGFGWAYYRAHQVVSPITGRKKFISVTREQYLKVAAFETENYVEQYKEQMLPPTDPVSDKVLQYVEEYKEKMLPATDPVYDKVLQVANHLVRANQDMPGMKDNKWTIHVVKDEQKNAFVLPNGTIFVFTGILEFCQNADQFGVVLGHEMAHALLLHAAQQISFAQFIDWFVIFGMALIWFILPNDGIAVVANWFYQKIMELTVHMPYSRDLEEEADLVGLQLAAKACFDVREGSVFWMRMTVSDDLQGEKRIPEWLSTHPTHNNRVKNLNELIPKAISIRDGCNCPRLPETDPRVLAIKLRTATNEVLLVRGSRANPKSIEKTKVQRPIFNQPKL